MPFDLDDVLNDALLASGAEDDNDLYRAVRQLAAEIEAAWSALGTTAEEAADDPDVARLSDAIRVCRRYDEDQNRELKEELERVRVLLSAVYGVVNEDLLSSKVVAQVMSQVRQIHALPFTVSEVVEELKVRGYGENEAEVLATIRELDGEKP